MTQLFLLQELFHEDQKVKELDDRGDLLGSDTVVIASLTILRDFHFIDTLYDLFRHIAFRHHSIVDQ